MTALVLRGGRVVDPRHGVDGLLEVRLERGRVTALGQSVPAAGAEVLDVSGHLVLPAFIDLRGVLDSERDVTQALDAGFTTVLAAPGSRLLQSPQVRILPAAPLTAGLNGVELGEVPEGVRCLSMGFRPLTQAGVMRRALQYALPFGALVMVHAEDPTLTGKAVLGDSPTATRLGLLGSPVAAESSVVARDLELLREVGGRLHFAHLTCARSLALVARAKAEGLQVSCDVTPHHLTLDDSAAEDFSLKARVWPPLRTAADVEALRSGLLDGTVDAVASDHVHVEALDREHAFEECKPGVESYPRVLAALGAVGLSPRRLAEVLSATPARLLGLEVGHLAAGAPADVTVVAQDFSRVAHTIRGGNRV